MLTSSEWIFDQDAIMRPHWRTYSERLMRGGKILILRRTYVRGAVQSASRGGNIAPRRETPHGDAENMHCDV